MILQGPVLCTFPGKHGDCLWALPTMRAIAEAVSFPVDLALSNAFGGQAFRNLLQVQPYLRQVKRIREWETFQTAPMTPWKPTMSALRAEGLNEHDYSAVVHLGYREWPRMGLPQYVRSIAAEQLLRYMLLDISFDPWIEIPGGEIKADWFSSPRPGRRYRRIAVGFTDEWFELKLGLSELLNNHDIDWDVRLACGSPRWNDEAGAGGHTWVEAADLIQQAEVFVGCCSALHVLSVAMGKPTVVIEPAEARWNSIFWPLGTDGDRVWQVRGGDGRPTFDARHMCDTVTKVLEWLDQPAPQEVTA